MTQAAPEREPTSDEASLPAELQATTKGGFVKTWTSTTLASFESPVYRLLWSGTFLAFIAFNMAGTAQNVVAFDLTGNNRSVGTVMFGQGLAMLVLNPFGGAIADRLNKRLLLLATQAVMGGIALTIAVLLSTDRLSVPLLAIGAFVTGSMFAFLVPTRTSLLGEIVPRERIGNAMALVQVAGNIGRIGAPFMAGLLLSWSLVGPAGTYFIIFGLLVFVLFFMSRIPAGGIARTGRGSVIQELQQGFRYVLESQRLLHGMVSHYSLTALGFCFFVLMPGYVKLVLGQGTAEVGLMLGVGAVGGLVGSVIVASLADSQRTSFYLKIAGALSVSGLVGLGLAPSLPWAMLAMVGVGSGVAAFQTLNNAVELHRTDPAYYGRVMGLMQIAWGLLLLVSLPTGYLADQLGERTVFAGAGATLGSLLILLSFWERQFDEPLT